MLSYKRYSDMEKNKKNSTQEEKVGVIPAEDIQGSDADLAFPKDDEAKQSQEQAGSDSETDKNN